MKKTTLLFTFIIVGLFSSCEEILKGLEHDSDSIPEESCSDAFAINIQYPDHYNCFLEDGFTNWGWTNRMTHTHLVNYKVDNDSFFQIPIYANANDCDTSIGNEIGYIEFEGVWERIDQDTIFLFMNIKYVLTNTNYSLSEVNLYIGNENYPKDAENNDSISPSDYTYNIQLNGEKEYLFTKIDWPGTQESYVPIIANAIVCIEN